MAVTTTGSLRVTGCQETWDESLSLRTTLAVAESPEGGLPMTETLRDLGHIDRSSARRVAFGQAAFPFASYLTSFSARTPMRRIFVARGFSLASKNGTKSPATAV